MRRTRRAAGALALTLVLASAGSATASDAAWQQVGTGTTGGVSGLAPDGAGWVVVRDNKVAGQNRVARLGADGRLTPLTWRGTAAQDLEAVTAVPGSAGRYAVLTSTGTGYLVSLDATSVTVQRTFTVPRGTSGVESFALTPSGAAVVALWATRGSTTAPATVFAATFDVAAATFGRVATAKVTVPYPTTALRQVSDLTVTRGRVISSAASDPGANGPFASALYDVGTVSVAGGRAVLGTHTPVLLASYDGHKVEGVACGPAGGLLGADDEKRGGWVRAESFC